DQIRHRLPRQGGGSEGGPAGHGLGQRASSPLRARRTRTGHDDRRHPTQRRARRRTDHPPLPAGRVGLTSVDRLTPLTAPLYDIDLRASRTTAATLRAVIDLAIEIAREG